MQSRDLLQSSYVWVGQFRLCSNLINGGVAIRMSWYAFFEKKNSRGGTSIPDWRVTGILKNGCSIHSAHKVTTIKMDLDFYKATKAILYHAVQDPLV